jgi:hypothetical protein
MAVHTNVPDGSVTGSTQETETFCTRVEAVKAFLGADPDDAVRVFEQRVDEIAADAGAVVGVVPEDLERVPVKTVEPVLGAEPEKSPSILQTANNGIVGKAILHLEVAKIVRLPLEDMPREQGEEGQYGGFGGHYR